MLRRIKDENASPALRRILFAGPLSAKVSVYADDITVFVSRRLNEQVAGAKINFDKSESLQVDA